MLLVSYVKQLVEKIIHRSCFIDRRHHNNNVIIKKFLCMFKIKFPIKRIFRIFPILRISGMVPFCNLFIERSSYNSEFLAAPKRSFDTKKAT